jgi:hypothetical protein
MGCGVSSIDLKYSENMGAPKEGESEVRRHPMFIDKLLDSLDENTTTL